MKKPLFLLLLLFSGCRDNTIYHEYHSITGVWDVVSISPETTAPLNFIHLSCNASKKNAGNENQACHGYINATKDEKGKLTMVYKIANPKEITIKYITDGYQGNMDDQDKKIQTLLVGTWTYTVDNDTLIWKSDKEIIFKKRTE
ncbi:MAG: hypothetical protein KF870_03495 [Leadbetterella sp.]|nr:hypothetical protein [Leadbetterella sp.]